jgi:hypothetical protein
MEETFFWKTKKEESHFNSIKIQVKEDSVMRVLVPLMIQDPSTARYKGMKDIYERVYIDEDYFLDGPVTRRIAVLDFCPQSGELLKGVPFCPPKRGRVTGSYNVGENIYSPGFIQVNVFTTVWKTINMFEKHEILGRPITWAFPAEQLLLVPRAGEMANAYYERDSHIDVFWQQQIAGICFTENRRLYRKADCL